MKKTIVVIILLVAWTVSIGQQKKLDDFIKEYAAKQNFHGTILVHKDKKVIYEGGYGFANRQFSIPNNTDTKFKIASVTKLFTAVLILQLYEKGKIDLNAPIKTYLPDYKGEGAARVTIHHLLNHTSGIENIEKDPTKEFKNPWFDVYQKPYSTGQLLDKFCSGKLETEPGKKFNYNNGDYIILGKIIEQQYQNSFDKIVTSEILEPLELNHTGMFYQSSVIPNLANTYAWNDSLKTFENDRQAYIENWYASGGMFSNTHDLLKFTNTLFEFKLIKAETLKLLLTPGLDNYGYGVWIRDVEINRKSYKTMQRFGRIRGANAVLYKFLDSDITIVILGNTSAITNLGSFAYEIGKIILE